MPGDVVVDSTVWIDFLRRTSEPVFQAVSSLLRSDRVVLVGMVIAEVLQGIKSPAELRLVEDHFTSLFYLETTRETWHHAGELSRDLRSKGKTVPLSDLLIASIALKHGLSVYTTDQHFASIPHLILYKPGKDSISP